MPDNIVFDSTPSSVQSWLCGRIGKELKIDPGTVDMDEPFSSFELDSIVWVSLANDLADWIDREIDPTIFWEYHSINELSNWIADHTKDQPN